MAISTTFCPSTFEEDGCYVVRSLHAQAQEEPRGWFIKCFMLHSVVFFSWKSQAELEIRLQAETTFTNLQSKEHHRQKFAPNSHNKMRGVHDSLIANQQRTYIFAQRSNTPFWKEPSKSIALQPMFHLYLFVFHAHSLPLPFPIAPLMLLCRVPFL